MKNTDVRSVINIVIIRSLSGIGYRVSFISYRYRYRCRSLELQQNRESEVGNRRKLKKLGPLFPHFSREIWKK